MDRIVGIDLGTSNSVVAIVDGPTPRVLDNMESKPQTPSVVSLLKPTGKKGGEGELLVGEPAQDNWSFATVDTIFSVKRLMGRGFADPEVQKVRQNMNYRVVEPSDGTRDGVRVLIGSKEYSPVDISVEILKKLKTDAEFRLKAPVTYAVITVPAYFSEIQRAATRRAAVKAGLKVIKLLDEPTAAAIAFGREAGDGTPKTLLVFDLGGGTFDISVLMWAGNVFAPLNLEGDMWLGGDNLDQVMVDYAIQQVRDEFNLDPTSNKRFMVELKRAARAGKERLSAARSARIVVTGVLQDADHNLIDVDVHVTREQFERMILPLVGIYKECSCGQPNYGRDEACFQCGRSIRTSPVRDGKAVALVRKALANAHLTTDHVDYVLMAGNATSVPVVQQTMEDIFGASKIMRTIHPKHCVALGAAMLAAMIGPQVICQAKDPADAQRECGHANEPGAESCAKCGTTLRPDIDDSTKGPEIDIVLASGGIAPFSYGTQTAEDQFIVFVKKGDPFPTTDHQPQTFFTRSPNQRMISIPVYGGDDLTKASRNEKQGEAFAILPPGLPKDTPVRIKLWLDADGIFHLSARLEDGTDLRPWVTEGEADAKAIDVLMDVEQRVVAKNDAIPIDEKRRLEDGRNAVFQDLRQGRFERALENAREVLHQADGLTRQDELQSLRTGLQNAVINVEFVLMQYGWLIDPNQAYRLTNLVEDAKASLNAEGAPALQVKLAEIEQAWAALPPDIHTYLWLRQEIGRVQPVQPVIAANLFRELETLEADHKGGRLLIDKFNACVEKVLAAAAKVPDGRREVCPNGHEVAAGKRHCPVCGADRLRLGVRPSVASNSDTLRSL
jgi:molecular chaperone DnaK